MNWFYLLLLLLLLLLLIIKFINTVMSIYNYKNLNIYYILCISYKIFKV